MKINFSKTDKKLVIELQADGTYIRTYESKNKHTKFVVDEFSAYAPQDVPGAPGYQLSVVLVYDPLRVNASQPEGARERKAIPQA